MMYDVLVILYVQYIAIYFEVATYVRTRDKISDKTHCRSVDRNERQA